MHKKETTTIAVFQELICGRVVLLERTPEVGSYCYSCSQPVMRKANVQPEQVMQLAAVVG